jgi:hypothetical protein
MFGLVPTYESSLFFFFDGTIVCECSGKKETDYLSKMANQGHDVSYFIEELKEEEAKESDI